MKEAVRTVDVSSVKEIDDLRKVLQVDDAYISVEKKYNDDFWVKKTKKPESTQKRGREHDDSDVVVSDPKRPSADKNSQ